MEYPVRTVWHYDAKYSRGSFGCLVKLWYVLGCHARPLVDWREPVKMPYSDADRTTDEFAQGMMDIHFEGFNFQINLNFFKRCNLSLGE